METVNAEMEAKWFVSGSTPPEAPNNGAAVPV